jgi:hypothetical protein
MWQVSPNGKLALRGISGSISIGRGGGNIEKKKLAC